MVSSSHAVGVTATVAIAAAGIGWIYTKRKQELKHYSLKCACGKVQMRFEVDSWDMKSLICHCGDCRRFVKWVESQPRFPSCCSTPIGAVFPGMPSVPLFAVYTHLLQPADIEPFTQVWCRESNTGKSTLELQEEYGVPAGDVVNFGFVVKQIGQMLNGLMMRKNHFNASLFPADAKLADYKSFAPVISE